MEEENSTVPVDIPEQTTEDNGDQEVTEGDQNQNNGNETEQAAEPTSGEPASDTPGSGIGEVTEDPVSATETTAEDDEKGEAVSETPQSVAQEEGGEQQTESPAEVQEGTTETTTDDTAAPDGEGKENVDQGESGTGEQTEGGGEQTEEAEQHATAELPKEGEAGEESAVGESGESAVAEGEEPPAAEGTESAGVESQEKEQTPEDGQISAEGGEGERAESPVAVGVKLSREGSPSQMMDPDQMPEILEPGTPDGVSETGDDITQQEMMEEDEDETEMEPEFDREQLIERYHAAIQERDQLQQQNYQLQHKIAEYFRKKKSDDSRQDFDKNVSDQEQRYIKYMANLEELRKQEGQERENYRVQIEELKDRCGDKQERVEGERQKFIDFKKQVAVNSLNSRSGKTIPPKDIEQYLSAENKKDNDVITVRLENIKLKNKLKKKEQQLKSKEELAEGLHLIDFEQLKIENQTYNEKIEERNEELLKLRKKITSTVQVLTHLKEKLQFVQAENQVQNGRLKEVEAVAAQKRDVLSRTKQARDALRIDNQKLRQNCGLLGNESLLRDFEEQRDESDDLKMKLEKLRMQHAELTLNCNQVRRKIEQVRMSQM